MSCRFVRLVQDTLGGSFRWSIRCLRGHLACALLAQAANPEIRSLELPKGTYNVAKSELAELIILPP